MACLTPIHVKPKPGAPPACGYSTHSVPCGKCAKCRLTRIQGWVFRLKQEMKRHHSAWFVCLTYDPANVPISKNGFMTLSRGYYNRETGKHVDGDLTKFFKKLRNHTKCSTIKYYAVGEYGGETERPHYHLIIFDVEPDDIKLAWTNANGFIGHIHFGQVTDDSIAYCAKYCAKESRIPMFLGDDRIPEFSVMSKHIGDNYLTPAIRRYHEEGLKSYLTMPGGATHAMPRYYRNRLFTDADRESMNSGLAAKYDADLLKGFVQYGYNPALDKDCEANRIAIDEYYRARGESVRATNKAFFKANKRDKI